jgi:hypothetical protein
MKAITIHEPYVSAILALRKRYETRGWKTDYRGDVVLCTAKVMTADERQLALSDHYKDVWGDAFHLGCAVGIAMLVDCLPCEMLMDSISDTERALGYWQAGNYAFELSDVRWFAYPVPVRGQLGLWTYRGELPLMEAVAHV